MRETTRAVRVPPTSGALELLRDRGSITSLYQGRRAADAQELMASAKQALEQFLDEEPENYAALVALGELDLRIGLTGEAQALLYRASLQRPPSWEAYQRTSLLLRRAEALAQHAFDRPAGAPPPIPLLGLARLCRTWLARLDRRGHTPPGEEIP